MTSRAVELVASPSWGAADRLDEEAPRTAPRVLRRVRWGIRGSTAADLGGAALVLGATLALWSAFFVAVG